MPSYPAAKRSGQTETLMYAERERLYDRGLDRDKINSLMERLQAKLGSKNKLAEAIYHRKNAASRVKQVMEGAQRYTDAVLDRILEVAEQNDVPKILPDEVETEVAVDEAAMPVDTEDSVTTSPTAAAEEAGIPDPDEGPADLAVDAQEAPAVPVDDEESATMPAQAPAPTSEFEPAPAMAPEPEHPEPVVQEPEVAETTGEQPAEHRSDASCDWLAGVRGRRADLAEQVAGHDASVAERRAAIEMIQAEIDEISARREADSAAIGEIDTALSILQKI